jgi:uncharacterized protein YegL
MLNRNNVYTALLLALVLSAVTFAQSEKRVAYGVLIDNTGSLRTQFNFVKALGKGLIEHILQRGSVSLFNFTTQGDAPNGLAIVTSGVEWSQDKAILNNYIDGLMVKPGRTALFDAIYSIAENVNAKASLDKDAFDSKVIILITDGEDRVSKVKEKQLIEKLKESGIKVYSIGLVQELEFEGGLMNKSPKAKAEDFFKKSSKETGGNFIFPKSNKVDVDSLLNELFAGPHRK